MIRRGRSILDRWSRGLSVAFFAAPATAWVLAFIVLPYLTILLYAIWRTDYVEVIRSPTLANLGRLLTDEVVRKVAVRSLWIALAVTAACVALAYPLAYLAAFWARRKAAFVFAVVAPMWVSYIVRAYSWRIILGEHGINIATMEVAREAAGGLALMGLTVDSPVPPDVLEEVRGAVRASAIRSIVLPA